MIICDLLFFRVSVQRNSPPVFVFFCVPLQIVIRPIWFVYHFIIFALGLVVGVKQLKCMSYRWYVSLLSLMVLLILHWEDTLALRMSVRYSQAACIISPEWAYWTDCSSCDHCPDAWEDTGIHVQHETHIRAEEKPYLFNSTALKRFNMESVGDIRNSSAPTLHIPFCYRSIQTHIHQKL